MCRFIITHRILSLKLELVICNAGQEEETHKDVGVPSLSEGIKMLVNAWDPMHGDRGEH